MKIWGLLFALPVLAACATTESVEPRIELVDRPPIQATSQVEVGQAILEKGKLSTFDGLRLKNQLTWGDGLILRKFTIEPGQLRAGLKDETYTYFFSDRMRFYDALKGTMPYDEGGLCTMTDDPSHVRLFVEAGRCSINPNAKPDIEPVRITDEGAQHFRQELIYTGRSGETVKFLYREFSGERSEMPLSQDVQYDLKDGNVVGFKGARIEILEATNTKLAYRVLASFQDAP